MLNRVCMIGDHDSKQIECVCTYKYCQMVSRFVCAKCLKIENHKHHQSNNSHLLDKDQLYEYLKEEFYKSKKAQVIADRSNFLKQNINVIHQYLKNISNLDDKMDQDDYNNQDVLQKIQDNGFNEIEEVELENLLNINRQHERIVEIYQQFKHQAEMIIQQSTIIKDWCQEQIDITRFQIADLQMIYNFRDKFITLDKGSDQLLTSAISNDLKYIVSGGHSKVLKIWNYDCSPFNQIKLDSIINICKFTDDSRFLYVGSYQVIYQIDVNAQFRVINKLKVHDKAIYNLYCISDTLLLSSSHETIVKTNFNLKQQQLVIQAHDYYNIFGLDYNSKLNLILSGSDDQSLSLWDGNNGQMILEKQNAHLHEIYQVLFILRTNQIISLDCNSNNIIWNINSQLQQIEKYKEFNDQNGIYNISLVLDQYVLQISKQYIQILSIYGEQIRLFLHDIKDVYLSKTIQPQSMRALIIEGEKTLNICKLEL